MKNGFPWDDVLVYLVTFLGAFTTQYIKIARSGGHLTFDDRMIHLLLSLAFAFGFVLHSEGLIHSPASRAGKIKNIRRRLAEGWSHGIGWSGLEALAT